MDVLDYIKDRGTGQVIWAITNVCNAQCGFCSYPTGKAGPSRWVDFTTASTALDIMKERNWRIVSFTGGEPLLNPDVYKIIAYAVRQGFITRTGTNGRILSPEVVAKLQETGLRNFWISIDSEDEEMHNQNRGLPGVLQHIKMMIPRLKEAGIRVNAAVPVNKLIGDYERFFDSLCDMGLDTVAFCYPMTVMEASYGGAAQSSLVEFTPEELIEVLDTIKRLKKERYGRMRVINPEAGLVEIINSLEGKTVRYPCLGGYKCFYLDWNLTLYKCAYKAENYGSLLEISREREFPPSRCGDCVWQCFRDPAVYYYLLGAMAEAGALVRSGAIRQAWQMATGSTVRDSLGAWRRFLQDRCYG